MYVTKVEGSEKIPNRREHNVVEEVPAEECIVKDQTGDSDSIPSKDVEREKMDEDLKHQLQSLWKTDFEGSLVETKVCPSLEDDCAASYGRTSLNQQLLQGPDQTNQLTGVLIRFREALIATVADVEAMFHQVQICERFRIGPTSY